MTNNKKAVTEKPQQPLLYICEKKRGKSRDEIRAYLWYNRVGAKKKKEKQKEKNQKKENKEKRKREQETETEQEKNFFAADAAKNTRTCARVCNNRFKKRFCLFSGTVLA